MTIYTKATYKRCNNEENEKETERVASRVKTYTVHVAIRFGNAFYEDYDMETKSLFSLYNYYTNKKNYNYLLF